MIQAEDDKPIKKINIGFLIKKAILNNGLMDIRKTGRKKVTVYFVKMTEANKLLSHVENDYDIYLPINFISLKGVISGVPQDITKEEIIKEIDTNLEIIEAYRMNIF